jgi:hypothetical protein
MALILAALIGSWLGSSAGIASADGGLLGDVLSSGQREDENADNAGLLDSVVETVDNVGTVGDAALLDNSIDTVTSHVNGSDDAQSSLAGGITETLGTVVSGEPATGELTSDLGTTVAGTASLAVDVAPVATASELVDSSAGQLLGGATIDQAAGSVLETELVDGTVENVLLPLTEEVTGGLSQAVEGAVEPVLSVTTGVETALAQTMEPLVTVIEDVLEPVLETTEGLVTVATGDMEPILTVVDESVAPLLPPLLEGEPPSPVTEPSSVTETVTPVWDPEPAIYAPVAGSDTTSTRIGVIRRDISRGPRSFAPTADVEGVQHVRTVVPRTSSAESQSATTESGKAPNSTRNALPGPVTWISSILPAQSGGSTSIGGLSAVLASLAALFLAPAIAARATVALLTPRSPYYLPVHPPD